MSLRADIDKVLENMQITLENHKNDINRLQGLIEDHFSPSTNKVVQSSSILRNLEKSILPGDGKP